MDLKDLGWNEFFESAFADYKDRFIPGRVLSEQKHLYKIITSGGVFFGELPGKMLYDAIEQQDLPAVGDWIAADMNVSGDKLIIQYILPRKSKFSRMSAWDAKEQIVAANIDYIFLIMSLNSNFNLRRLERYLTAAWDSGANPVVILSKSDLCEDIGEKVKSVSDTALGVPVHPISMITGYGIDALYEYMKAGKTIALVGSSGVGKSSLINYLMGHEVQKVNEIRDDDRGRHTSSYREMFILPQGGHTDLGISPDNGGSAASGGNNTTLEDTPVSGDLTNLRENTPMQTESSSPGDPAAIGGAPTETEGPIESKGPAALEKGLPDTGDPTVPGGPANLKGAPPVSGDPTVPGGLIVDTPGMRELGLWNGDVSETFEDIEYLTKKCRFSDCRHMSEPGCAIKKALSDGTLSYERYESYKKLQRELKHAKNKSIDLTRTIEKQKHKKEIKKIRHQNFDIGSE